MSNRAEVLANTGLSHEAMEDLRLLVGGSERLGFTPTRKQREAAVARLRRLVFPDA